MSNIEEIKNCVIEGYRKILSRNPDPNGLSYYIQSIQRGNLTKEKFLETLKNSDEYKTKLRQKMTNVKLNNEKSDNKKRLNLGCGIDRRAGYKNVDIRQDINPDIVLDIEKTPYPFETESIDEILANDTIEHFSFVDIDKIVREWNRILKIGGILIIRTPDLDVILSLIRKIKNWKDISWYIYGEQDYHYNFHKLIFTKEELKSFLKSVGFKTDEIHNESTNIVCKAIKV